MPETSGDSAATGTPPRTPILRPDRFFAEREFNALRLLVVISLLVLVAPVSVYGTGWVLATHVDGTVLVDNPARPPDWFCGGEPATPTDGESGCDQPRQVERDVDELIWQAMDRLMGPAMGAALLVWVLMGGLLHVGSWLGGGSGGVSSSFAVAAWGLVPGLAGPAIGLLLLYLWMDPVTVTPGTDPEAALEPAMAQIRSIRPYLTAVTLGTTAWGGVIWRFGLEHKRGIGVTEAWFVAGLCAMLIAVFAIV